MMPQKLRMSTILRLFFILVVIVPVIIICTIILSVYRSDIVGQNTERSLQTSQAVTYSVNQEISQMVGLFASIGVDQDVIQAVNNVYSLTGIEKQNAIEGLKILIEKYTASVSGRVLSVNFFFNDKTSYSYLKNMLLDESAIRRQTWYTDVLSKPNIVRFLGMQPNGLYGHYSPYMMTAALAPSDPNLLSKLEMIVFAFESGAFDHILQVRDNMESILHIISSKGEIIASNTIVERGSLIPSNWLKEIGILHKGSFADNSGVNKKLITYAKVDHADWYIVQIIPYKDLLANYGNVTSFVWLLAILIILAFIVISFYFVSNFTEPIRELLRQMVRVTGGDLHARYTGSGSLEMVRLGHSFNLMTEQVVELIAQHEKQEVEKRKAEFAALQSQINPHFLINTLNSIKFMALISKADNIRNMTHSLTRLLASSFNRGGLLIKIEEEIDHLKHYLHIMEIRFGRPILTEWYIDPEANHYYLLKLLLQPILENSIIHGIKDMDSQGKITVAMHIANRELVIIIADNGTGMSDELMTHMASPDERELADSFSGMGNKNVHKRIQLHYGTKYGLQYKPNTPRGTKVLITLPLISTPDEEGIDYRESS